MGFLRKAIIVGTGGLAPIKANSYKERTAKAAEKQLRVQQQALQQQQAIAASIAATTPGRVADDDGLAIVRLDAAGLKKIQVIKVVRAATGVGLKEAKDLVDNVPSVIADGMPLEQARRLAAELEAVGASGTVELASPDETEPEPPGNSLAGQLVELADLYERGLLTADEFAEAKARVFGLD